MKSPLRQRLCAVCGKPQSQQRGGLTAYSIALKHHLESGGTLKLPDSAYAHVRCMGYLRTPLPEAK
jgi:hypothetical protein